MISFKLVLKLASRNILIICLGYFAHDQAFGETTPVTIGGIFDLSSTGKIWGTAERNGFILAIEDFRAAHPDILVNEAIEDSEYSNPKSVTAFHKLTSISNAKMIVGPTWETFVSVMPLCEAKQIVCMAPSNNSQEFERPLKFSFTAYFDDRGYTSVLADEINRRGYQKIAIVANTSAYHDPNVDNILEKLNQRPIATERVLPNDRDFKSLIARIPVELDALIILLLGDGQLSKFLSDYKALSKTPQIIYTDDAPIFDERSSEIKQMGLPIRYSKQYIEPEYENGWNEKYKTRFGVLPEAPSASIAYDETSLLLKCNIESDSTASIADCLRATKQYAGQSGMLGFNGRQSIQNRTYRVNDF